MNNKSLLDKAIQSNLIYRTARKRLSEAHQTKYRRILQKLRRELKESRLALSESIKSLYYSRSHKQAEIAKILGMSQGRVSNLISYKEESK